MMTDRELLELAAKAAGIVPQWRDKTLSLYRLGLTDPLNWNPLIDDGDALRLAVDLGIEFESHKETLTSAAWKPGDGFVTESHQFGGAYIATRRAIVRAAAEIGKSMP